MSEKLYALLLRLYPVQFRTRYGEESVQLLRDRLRDEPGVFARLRLWFDLLADLAISLPRERRALWPTLAAGSPAARADGMPSFSVIEEQPPRPGALMVASLLSAAGLVAFFVLIDIAGARYPLRRARDEAAQSQLSRARASAAATPPATGTALGGQAAAPANASAGAGDRSAARASADNGTVAQVAFDPAERHRVAEAVAADLKRFYFDHAAGQEAADVVLRQEERGADNAARTSAEFAVLLTNQIRSATDDLHLMVEYSATTLPQQPAAQASPPPLAAYRTALLQDHCGIERVSTLPGNIGYLKLNAFPDVGICGSAMRDALTSINNDHAVIFDLSDNRGGNPDMVALVAGWLFPRPQPWYNPKEPGASLLAAPAAGSHLADKPVYILTSALTFSGAEQFSYNLKMLKRATLIGQTTGGAAHVGVFHRIDDHFGIGIPEFRIVNPYGSRDWEVVGVAPDVRTSPAHALATAERLAVQNLKASAR
jgi:hypothetical protein